LNSSGPTERLDQTTPLFLGILDRIKDDIGWLRPLGCRGSTSSSASTRIGRPQERGHGQLLDDVPGGTVEQGEVQRGGDRARLI
jgi:hypothetical protein